MADSVGKQVLTGVLSAAIIGGLTLIWNWSTQGGAIRALGGITHSELEDALKDASASSDEARFTSRLPPGVIAAFASRADISDTSRHCPAGWNNFEEARGRILIGAGIPARAGFNRWSQQQDDGKNLLQRELSQYRAFEVGGEEKHILNVREIPSHQHMQDLATRGGQGVYGEYPAGKFIIQGVTRVTNEPGTMTSKEGGGGEHSVMPPYLAVYYCITK